MLRLADIPLELLSHALRINVVRTDAKIATGTTDAFSVARLRASQRIRGVAILIIGAVVEDNGRTGIRLVLNGGGVEALGGNAVEAGSRAGQPLVAQS